MECETLRTDPRVFHVVLAVMEYFTAELLVGVVSGVLADAVELGLLQQLGETVGLFFLFFFLLFQQLLLQF